MDPSPSPGKRAVSEDSHSGSEYETVQKRNRREKNKRRKEAQRRAREQTVRNLASTPVLATPPPAAPAGSPSRITPPAPASEQTVEDIIPTTPATPATEQAVEDLAPATPVPATPAPAAPAGTPSRTATPPSRPPPGVTARFKILAQNPVDLVNALGKDPRLKFRCSPNRYGDFIIYTSWE